MDSPLSGRIFSLPVILMPIPSCTESTGRSTEVQDTICLDMLRMQCVCVCERTLGVLRGDEGLDEGVGAL